MSPKVIWVVRVRRRRRRCMLSISLNYEVLKIEGSSYGFEEFFRLIIELTIHYIESQSRFIFRAFKIYHYKLQKKSKARKENKKSLFKLQRIKLFLYSTRASAITEKLKSVDFHFGLWLYYIRRFFPPRTTEKVFSWLFESLSLSFTLKM